MQQAVLVQQGHLHSRQVLKGVSRRQSRAPVYGKASSQNFSPTESRQRKLKPLTAQLSGTLLEGKTQTRNSVVEFIHPRNVVSSLLARLQRSRTDVMFEQVEEIDCALDGLDSYFTNPSEIRKIDIYDVPASLCVAHPTLKVMLERKMRGSVPNRRRDGYKLGLVVEGGGMRGAVSGAMLMELRKLGFYDVFDVVYGSSAGAVNSAYFLTGQESGMDIYFDHLTSKRFIDFRRYFSPEPVLNLNFLIDSVMEEIVPLDWEGVLKSKIPLKIIASSLDKLKSVTLGEFKTKGDLATAMKASCTVPEIVGPPEVLDGQRLVDAAVFEPIPYKAAILDGCTHVLALCSRSRPRGARGKVKRAMKKIMDRAIKIFVLCPPYMKKAWKAEVEEMLNDGLDADDLMLLTMMQGLQGLKPTPIDGHIFALYPSTKYTIPPTCIDEELLRNGAKEARESVNRLFQPLVQSITPKKFWIFV